jgi:hypothetical protein
MTGQSAEDSDVSTTLTDLKRELAGPDGIGLLRALKRLLSNEGEWRKPKTFKVVELGKFPDTKTLLNKLVESNIELGAYVRDCFPQRFRLANRRRKVSLVVVSVSEMGFDEGATYAVIVRGARSRGLELCDQEVAPILRLEYQNQPVGDFLMTATEPFQVQGTCPLLFTLHNSGGLLYLDNYRCGDDINCVTWSGKWKFVFTLPD